MSEGIQITIPGRLTHGLCNYFFLINLQISTRMSMVLLRFHLAALREMPLGLVLQDSVAQEALGVQDSGIQGISEEQYLPQSHRLQ